MNPDTENQRVKCPYCAELILPEAKICRFCGRDLPLGFATVKSLVEEPITIDEIRSEANVLFESAKTLIANDKIFEGINTLVKAISLVPDVSEYHAWYADALNKNKQFEKALEEANLALQLDPNNGKAFRQRGNANWGLNNLQNAVDDNFQALRIDPRDTLASYNLASLYYQMEKYREAETECDKILAIHQDDFTALFLKGECAGRLSTPVTPRLTELVILIRRAVGIDKNSLSLPWLAIEISWLLWWNVNCLMDYFKEVTDVEVYGRKPANLGSGTYPRNATEKLQQDAGNLLAFYIMYGRKLKKYEKIFTDLFSGEYSVPLVEGLDLAWELDQSEGVANNTRAIFYVVKGSTSLDSNVQKKFLGSLTPLIAKIKAKYSGFIFNY